LKRLTLLFSIILTFSCKAEPLYIQTQGLEIEFNVKVANDDASREKGFMFRDQLDPKEGILFLYPTPHLAMMWMKNTYVPLDMLFIDQTGTIIYIHQNAVPRSLKVINSPKPVLAVLEIPGGQAKNLAIRQGDRIKYPAFSAQ
jgi:uncharacterized protein